MPIRLLLAATLVGVILASCAQGEQEVANAARRKLLAAGVEEIVFACRTPFEAGKHELRIEIVGANRAARAGGFGKYLFGLDYLGFMK